MNIAKLWFPGLLLFLSALSGQAFGGDWTSDQLNSIRNMPVQGSAFHRSLHREYLWVADQEYQAGDLDDALYFYGRRAETAARGDRVYPLDPTKQSMPGPLEPQAVAAYRRLMTVFERGGREIAPEAAARAQVAYDCWVHEWCQCWGQECGGYSISHYECWERFLAAIYEMEQTLALKAAPEPLADRYIVYFDFDRASIRPDAARVLDRVIEAAGQLGEVVIHATGHADRAGTRPYNQRLSERRVESVRRYLVQGGIAGYRIDTAAKGETDPRVPTPDGVREQENRRVELVLR